MDKPRGALLWGRLRWAASSTAMLQRPALKRFTPPWAAAARPLAAEYVFPSRRHTLPSSGCQKCGAVCFCDSGVFRGVGHMDVNLKPRPPPPGPAPPLSGCICSCCGCSSLSTPRTGDVAVVFRSSVPAKQMLEQFEDGFLSVLMAHGYVDYVKWDSACVKAVAVSPLLLALVPWRLDAAVVKELPHCCWVPSWPDGH